MSMFAKVHQHQKLHLLSKYYTLFCHITPFGDIDGKQDCNLVIFVCINIRNKFLLKSIPADLVMY